VVLEPIRFKQRVIIQSRRIFLSIETTCKDQEEKEMTLTDEIKTSVVVAEASTKAMTRSILYGTIPIIEFGVVIAFALLVAAVPLAIIKKVNK